MSIENDVWVAKINRKVVEWDISLNAIDLMNGRVMSIPIPVSLSGCYLYNASIIDFTFDRASVTLPNIMKYMITPIMSSDGSMIETNSMDSFNSNFSFFTPFEFKSVGWKKVNKTLLNNLEIALKNGDNTNFNDSGLTSAKVFIKMKLLVSVSSDKTYNIVDDSKYVESMML